MEIFKNGLCLAFAGLALAFVITVGGGYVELPTSIHRMCVTTARQSTGCAFLIQYN